MYDFELCCNSCAIKIDYNNMEQIFISDCAHVVCDRCLYIENICVVCNKKTNFQKLTENVYDKLVDLQTNDVFYLYQVQINSLIYQNMFYKQKIMRMKTLLEEAKYEIEHKQTIVKKPYNRYQNKYQNKYLPYYKKS